MLTLPASKSFVFFLLFISPAVNSIHIKLTALDVIIPGSDTEESVVLKEGEQVKIVKSEQGFYMQLDNGKVISIRNPIKTGDPTNEAYDSDEFEVLDSPLAIPSSGEQSSNPSPHLPTHLDLTTSTTPSPQLQLQTPTAISSAITAETSNIVAVSTASSAASILSASPATPPITAITPTTATTRPRTTNHVQFGRNNSRNTAAKVRASINGIVPSQSSSSFDVEESEAQTIKRNNDSDNTMEEKKTLGEIIPKSSNVLSNTTNPQVQHSPMLQHVMAQTSRYESSDLIQNQLGGQLVRQTSSPSSHEHVENGAEAMKTNLSSKKVTKPSKNSLKSDNAVSQANIVDSFSGSSNPSSNFMPQSNFGYNYDTNNMNGSDNLLTRGQQQQHIQAQSQLIISHQQQQQQPYQQHQHVVEQNQQQQSQKSKQQQATHDIYTPMMLNTIPAAQQPHQPVSARKLKRVFISLL